MPALIETQKIEDIIGDDYNGVISINAAGTCVFKKAYGYADLPNKRHNTLDTRFGTASAGKAFIASAVMKLIEDCKLSLDSNIGDILNTSFHQISKDITIAQLLNHTSGIPDYFDESVMEDYADLWVDYPNYRVRSSSDLIPLFVDKPMMYPPGERFQYNNTGYAVLGLVIEKVTGMAFDVFLSRAVFAPCDMRSTGYYELDRLPANCANAYIFDEKRKEYYTNIYSIDAKGTGAGGAFTTVDDVLRFWECLKSGGIVNADTVQTMLSPKVDSGEYGYGFWISAPPGKRPLPYFQGSDPGVSFISSCDEENLCITAVSNFGDNVWRIHKAIRNLLIP